MADRCDSEICRRIAQVRQELAGPRGKSAFAKRLGLAPSTYDYYEDARVPPADVLLRIADLAGVDLHWLLTGQARGLVRTDHPVLQRAAALLARHSNAAAALGAFLDLLEASMRLPAKPAVPQEAPKQELKQQPTPPDAHDMRRNWIAVLGRSAAGVPKFWGQDKPPQEAQWQEVIAAHSRRCRSVHHAQAQVSDGPAQTVQIITLGQPDEDNVAEYVCAPDIKARYGDAFAVRIDGQSMAPEIRHGDLVILSPSQPATDGKPAVVQLVGQIGVTCKLYRQEGEQVHLIPLNESLPPQLFPAGQVAWALRVLARIRL